MAAPWREGNLAALAEVTLQRDAERAGSGCDGWHGDNVVEFGWRLRSVSDSRLCVSLKRFHPTATKLRCARAAGSEFVCRLE